MTTLCEWWLPSVVDDQPFWVRIVQLKGEAIPPKENKSPNKLSWVVPSSVVWVEVELSWYWVELKLCWSWNWVEIELDKYSNSSIGSNWSLQLKSCSILLLSRLGGWVAVLSGNKASKLKLKLSWVEAELGKKDNHHQQEIVTIHRGRSLTSLPPWKC